MSKEADTGNSWKNPNYAGNDGAEWVARTLLLGKQLRSRVATGWAMGTFVIEIPHPSTLTTLALAGFDFAVLDMEHSPLDFGRLEGLLDAGRAAGLPMLVRTWGKDSGLIGKVLDMGAHGIMAPHVDSAERASEIVQQARFAPRGGRGFSPLCRFDALPQPLAALNEATFVVVQIEGRKALENAAEIAAVPGIDVVFVGPYDLALSLGVEPGSAEVFEAAERIAHSVPTGTAMGLYIDDPATCGGWAQRGFAMQCVSFDSRMLATGAKQVAARARDSVTSSQPLQRVAD